MYLDKSKKKKKEEKAESAAGRKKGYIGKSRAERNIKKTIAETDNRTSA